MSQPLSKSEVVALVGELTDSHPRVAKWSARRLLSGLGHPGYGEAFAEAALRRMLETGESAHQAVYGLRPVA